MKTLISFRLRKLLDADLIAAGVDEDQLPDLCRDGLRLMLGLNTKRHLEVKEKPIITAPHSKEVRLTSPSLPSTSGKPAVYIPQQQRRV